MKFSDLGARLREPVAQTFLRYAGSSVVLQAVSLGSGVVVLRWLAPADLGLWQALLLIGTYSTVVQGGVINGLNRELPFAMGSGNAESAATLAGTARQVALVGAMLCLACIPLAAFLAEGGRRWGGASLVLMAAAGGIYRNYLGATYRSTAAFDSLGRIQLFEAAAALVTLPLVMWFGYWGLGSRYVLLSVFGVSLMHRRRPLPSVGAFQWSALRSLLQTGVPLFVFGYLIGVAGTFPKLVLLSEGGTLWVGLFAPAAAMATAMMAIPDALSRFIYPRMSFRLGETGDSRVLWPMAVKSSVGVILASIPIVGALWFAVGPMIEAWFPAYAASVPSLRWTLVAGLFHAASASMNALNSVKAWPAMACYAVVSLAGLYFLPAAGVSLSGTLESVAAGWAAAEALRFGVGMTLIWWVTVGRNPTLERPRDDGRGIR